MIYISTLLKNTEKDNSEILTRKINNLEEKNKTQLQKKLYFASFIFSEEEIIVMP